MAGWNRPWPSRSRILEDRPSTAISIVAPGGLPLGNRAAGADAAERFPPDRLTVFCGNCPDQPAKLFCRRGSGPGRRPLFSLAGLSAALATVATACRDLENGDLDWLGFVGPRAGMEELFCRKRKNFITRPLLVLRTAAGVVPGGRAANEFSGDGRVSRDTFVAARVRGRLLAAFAMNWPAGLPACRRAGRRPLELGDFPLDHDFRVPRYLSHSYRVRTAEEQGAGSREPGVSSLAVARCPLLSRPASGRIRGRSPAHLAADCRDGWMQGARSTEQAACNSHSPLPAPRSAASRIAVIGGPWEYVHNRLCFYNHFRSSKGKDSSPTSRCWTAC